MKQLYHDVEQKNKRLKRDIDNKERKTYTAERKVYYEFQNIDKIWIL